MRPCPTRVFDKQTARVRPAVERGEIETVAGLVPELVRTDSEERALGPHSDRSRPQRATGRPFNVDNPDRGRQVGDGRRAVPMLHLDPGRGGVRAEGAEPGDVLLDHVPTADDNGQAARSRG